MGNLVTLLLASLALEEVEGELDVFVLEPEAFLGLGEDPVLVEGTPEADEEDP